MIKNNKNIKVGLFVGKFLPPHIGHTNQILKCLDYCDKLIVIVADSKKRSKLICKNANIKTIYAKTRLKWLKKHFKNYKDKITFKFLNQGMLEAFPNNLDDWKKKLKKVTKNNFDYWFVDKNYLQISKQYFPEYNFIGFDRSEINISASEIRNNLSDKNYYIIEEAQKKINTKNKKMLH